MVTIVHKIRLREDALQQQFERWVLDRDYAAARDLPSVRGFWVCRSESVTAQTQPLEYFETILVTSLADFAQDMKLPLFASLVAEFEKMAEVIEGLEGEVVGVGYPRLLSEAGTARAEGAE